MDTSPPSAQQPLPQLATSPAMGLVVDAMLLCWLLAVVIAVWGAVTESARADRERRRALATEDDPGPTPGIDGFLDRWGLWSLLLAALGLLLLAYLSQVAHR